MTVSELSDYITRRKKNKKSQYLNEAQNGCTHSRIRIVSTYLQIALPIPFVMQTAPGPHGLGSHGSGFSAHRWFKQTSPYWQSGSLTHSGPHPVMVSGFGIMPGTQLQMALPTLLTVQMVLGPQGEGWQGFTGALVVRLTKMWIGDRGTMGIRLDLKCVWIKENMLILTVMLYYLGRRTWTGLRGTIGIKGVLKWLDRILFRIALLAQSNQRINLIHKLK